MMYRALELAVVRAAGVPAIRVQPWILSVALAASALVLYLLTGSAPNVETTFPQLARALIDGQLSIPFEESRELIRVGDRGYVPLPPIPALAHLPFELAGVAIHPQALGASLAAVAVGMAHVLLRRMGVAAIPALVIVAGFATSTLWMQATESGRMWMFAHMASLPLLLGALLVAWSRQWPLAAGVLLGLAAGSRIPMGLALPLILYLYRGGGWRAWAEVLLGVAAIAAPLAAYNIARFGSPIEFGHSLIPSGACAGTVQCEPWYGDGIMSLSYVPRSIGAALFAGFHIRNEAPWLLPSGTSLSLAITAPVYLLAVGAGWSRLAAIAWATVAIIMLPNLAHGAWGFWQYGYRFILDASPVLVLLLGLAYRDRATWRLGLAVVGGALATAWGILTFHVWHLTA